MYGACGRVVGSCHASHSHTIVVDELRCATVELVGHSSVLSVGERAGDALNASPLNGRTVDDDGMAHTHHVLSDMWTYAVALMADCPADHRSYMFVDGPCLVVLAVVANVPTDCNEVPSNGQNRRNTKVPTRQSCPQRGTVAPQAEREADNVTHPSAEREQTVNPATTNLKQTPHEKDRPTGHAYSCNGAAGPLEGLGTESGIRARYWPGWTGCS